MRYWLGPWQKHGRVWRKPPGAIASIDLRGESYERNVAIFVTPDRVGLGSDYRHFDAMPRESDRRVFASMVGTQASGDSIIDWLWTALTVHADPRGERSARPLTPTSAGVLEMYLHGLKRRRPFRLGSDEAQAAITQTQEGYRRLRRQALDGLEPDPFIHRRVLDYLGEQYGISNPEDVFIPRGLPRETRLEHHTRITDNFDRANGAIGNSSEGWSWSHLTISSGTASIVSNVCSISSNAVFLRAQSSLSGGNHYSQLEYLSRDTGMSMGPIVRMDAGDDKYYRYETNTNYHKLFYYNEVSETEIQAGTDNSLALPHTLKLEINGTTLTGYREDQSRVTQTDTNLPNTRLRCGFFSSISSTLDDFVAEDLAAAGGQATNKRFGGVPGMRLNKGVW